MVLGGWDFERTELRCSLPLWLKDSHTRARTLKTLFHDSSTQEEVEGPADMVFKNEVVTSLVEDARVGDAIPPVCPKVASKAGSSRLARSGS